MKPNKRPQSNRLSTTIRLLQHPDSKRWLLIFGIMLFLLAIAWSQPGLVTMGMGGEKAPASQITGTPSPIRLSPSPEKLAAARPALHQTDGMIITSLILVLIILLGTLRTIRTTIPPSRARKVRHKPESTGKKK